MSRSVITEVETVLVVGIGGFAGSNLRYFVDLSVPNTLLATATVNVLGSLALGFLVYEKHLSGRISQPSRTLMATGFLASFTTYSTFIVDAITTTPLVASAYVIGSYAIGFGAVLLGREGARRFTPVATTHSEGLE